MKLTLLKRDKVRTAGRSEAADPRPGPPAGPLDAESIRGWLSTRMATLVEIAPEEVDPRRTFTEYGLDSMQAVRLSGDLESWLGRELSPLLLYDYPSIEAISLHLSGAEADVATGLPGCPDGGRP